MDGASSTSTPLTAHGESWEHWGEYRYRYRYSPQCSHDSPCAVNGVEVELAPSILHSLITARSVTGEALGFAMKLTAEDQRALAQFEARIGLAGEKKRDP